MGINAEALRDKVHEEYHALLDVIAKRKKMTLEIIDSFEGVTRQRRDAATLVLNQTYAMKRELQEVLDSMVSGPSVVPRTDWHGFGGLILYGPGR